MANKKIMTTILATITASLCCITPVEAILECKTCVVEVKKQTKTSESNNNCETRKAQPIKESKKLSVFKYMNDEKLHPTACNQIACTGSGNKYVDVMMERARKTVPEMSPAVLKKMLDDAEDVILLDVRELSKKTLTTIPTDDESYSITRGNIELQVHKILDDKNAVIVTFCRSGFRGLMAGESLKQLGYKNVYNLSAGLKGWARAGYKFQENDKLVSKKESEI